MGEDVTRIGSDGDVARPLALGADGDVARPLALGADAVSIGTAVRIAMGDNSPEYLNGVAAGNWTGALHVAQAVNRLDRQGYAPEISDRAPESAEVAELLRKELAFREYMAGRVGSTGVAEERRVTVRLLLQKRALGKGLGKRLSREEERALEDRLGLDELADADPQQEAMGFRRRYGRDPAPLPAWVLTEADAAIRKSARVSRTEWERRAKALRAELGNAIIEGTPDRRAAMVRDWLRNFHEQGRIPASVGFRPKKEQQGPRAGRAPDTRRAGSGVPSP